MKQFTFEQKQKNFLLGLMALGFVSLIASYFVDTTLQYEPTLHTRFWTNLLQNSAFFTLISFTAIFATAATLTMYAGWHTAFKRIWEAFGMFLPIGLAGIAIVGVASMMHLHHIYHWADAVEVAKDKILTGKKGFLNFGFYFASIIVFGGAWYFFMRKFRELSLAQDNDSDQTEYPFYQNVKVWAAVFLPIAGFTSAAAIWLWLMSIDAHWYSTMFAWYTTASAWVSCLAITILMLIYLKSKGYFVWVTDHHMHDLGKLAFAFSVFWTYLWFSQYMLIWYANIGEETIYFHQRMGEFPVLFYGNLVLNFILPFLILIRNDNKRKFGTMAFASILILVGHWWDFFQIVKIGPYKSILDHHAAGAHGGEGHGATGAAHGAEHATGAAEHVGTAVVHGAEHAAGAAEHGAAVVAQATEHGVNAVGQVAEVVGHGAENITKAVIETPALDALAKMNAENYFHYTPDMTAGFGLPGFFEIFTFLGFGALFVYFVFNQLSKASLIPENDPYLEETLNHHVV